MHYAVNAADLMTWQQKSELFPQSCLLRMGQDASAGDSAGLQARNKGGLMTTNEWVRKLNKLGREIDEWAASIHPSAWDEELKAEMEKWRKLAKYQPVDEPVQLSLFDESAHKEDYGDQSSKDLYLPGKIDPDPSG